MKKRIISLITAISVLATLILPMTANAKEISGVNFTDKMKKDFADYCLALPDFDQSTVATSEFAANFIFYHYANENYRMESVSGNPNANRRIKADLSQKLFRLLFGVDMADPTLADCDYNGTKITYDNGYYYSNSGDYGDNDYVFDSLIPTSDGFEVVYSLSDSGGTIYYNNGKKNQRICSVKYADNENGYILTSLKNYKPIRVMLNGQEVSFPQPPVMQNDRVLVPIRQIAEAMGDDVLWNEDTNSAMIKHGSHALVIRLNDDKIEVVDDKHAFLDWDRKELDVPAQLIGDSTLVPVRAFCEALLAEVEWDSGQNIVNIKYDDSKRGKDISGDIIENINVLFKMLYKDTDDFRFTEYSEDMSNFYNSTSKWKNAIIIGLSDIESGVKLVFDGLWEGKNPKTKNSEEIVKKSIAEVLANVPDNPAVEFNAYNYTGFEQKVGNVNDIFNDILGENAGVLKNEVNALKTGGKVIDWSAFSVNELNYILNDYSVSIGYLNAFKENCEDKFVKDVIDEMIAEYSNKWVGSLYDLTKKTLHADIKKEIGEALTEGTADAAVSAVMKEVNLLYDVSTFAMDIWNELIGLNDLSEDLCIFSGILIYNPSLDIANSKAVTKALGSIDSYENMHKALSNIRYLFNLEKATKITAYQKIKEITNDDATKKICDERIAELNELTYMLWQ